MSELDPVFRCDSCNRLVLLKMIHKIGCCNHCGNKRMKDISVFDDSEAAQMKQWGLDDFLKEFEPVKEEDDA